MGVKFICCLALLACAFATATRLETRTNSADIKLYYSSVSGNRQIKDQQRTIRNVLDSLGIEYQKIDVAASLADRTEMREGMDDPTGLPPQLFNGDVYLGDFDDFKWAVDYGDLNEFLRI